MVAAVEARAMTFAAVAILVKERRATVEARAMTVTAVKARRAMTVTVEARGVMIVAAAEVRRATAVAAVATTVNHRQNRSYEMYTHSVDAYSGRECHDHNHNESQHSPHLSREDYSRDHHKNQHSPILSREEYHRESRAFSPRDHNQRSSVTDWEGGGYEFPSCQPMPPPRDGFNLGSAGSGLDALCDAAATQKHGPP
jgi:hypothetical protein